MLYVTTRNHQDACTVSHVLAEDRGSDGGLFVPLNLPKLSEREIYRFLEMSFGQCVAELLNMFFSVKLTGWDVDFSVGRYPVRLEQLPHKIFMAEAWHNPDWNYLRLEKNLMELLQVEADVPGSWVSVAIRMAVLAGILGNGDIPETGSVDIAAVSGDFTVPISAWYLRKMGFPVGSIICGCNENNQFWDLLCNGQMHTDAAVFSTIVPEADITRPVNLERLISACGGVSETDRYLDCCRKDMPFSVSDAMLQVLRQGLYANVISSNRVETTIPNVYKTHNYVLSPASALAYAGMLDYRAKTGITRPVIVLCDDSPACKTEMIAKIMDMPVEALQKLI